MIRTLVLLACLLSALPLRATDQNLPTFDYDTARTHEIKPHRRTIPLEGMRPGFNQLHLKLTISSAGDVTAADPGNSSDAQKFWPQIQTEVRQWKFTPFERDGKAITAELEEYVDLVPPERFPKIHVPAPTLHPDSKVTITLQRSGCYGSCPIYTVEVSTEGIVFDGHSYVVAKGKHTDTIAADEVRKLAKKFVDADFYSMESSYRASVTDCPTYVLSIAVDGLKKEVMDYEGQWEGMPAIISELEDEIDSFAHTNRWIEGSDGLIESLKAEKYNFQTFAAQIILKEAAERGQAGTILEMLQAGVRLSPITAPKPKERYGSIPFESVGWLNAASGHSDAIQVLIKAKASQNDQSDKDLALAGAARSGKIEAVRMLIAYGANPNADLSRSLVTENHGGMILQDFGAGSILINAAESGNAEIVHEILNYHPNLEMKNFEGKSAIFSAGEYRYDDIDGARVECVRLLVQAGANVNARDKNANTPLHETFLTDVEEELIKLGADVNARNNDGETPIFTTVDDDAIALFIKHGADLTIRNKKGQTVVESAKAEHGQQRLDVLNKAIQEYSPH